MKFTYKGYVEMLLKLQKNGYETASYLDWKEKAQCVILRHDIDYDIDQAVKLAKIERDGGVTGTYFVLLTSDFYNVFSKENNDKLKQIIAGGHMIGLHFDEMRYPELAGDTEGLRQKIFDEAKILSLAVNKDVRVVSMHRPSRKILDADLQIPGMINSYGQEYFKSFKYISDSRRRWREPVDRIIESGEYKKLHILTHAFWYKEIEEDIHGTVSKFINNGNDCRYHIMESNITDLASIMLEDEVIRRESI